MFIKIKTYEVLTKAYFKAYPKMFLPHGVVTKVEDTKIFIKPYSVFMKADGEDKFKFVKKTDQKHELYVLDYAYLSKSDIKGVVNADGTKFEPSEVDTAINTLANLDTINCTTALEKVALNVLKKLDVEESTTLDFFGSVTDSTLLAMIVGLRRFNIHQDV